MYRVRLSPKAEMQMEHYKRSDTATHKKAMKLLAELALHPRTGTGQPEQLRHYTTPTWSRRLNKKDRMVYQINDGIVLVNVVSVRGHYGDR